MRGGTNSYEIVMTPVVALTVKLTATIEEFYGENVVSNIALLLGVRAGCRVAFVGFVVSL